MTIADPELSGGTLNIPGQGVGRYAVQDRDVFRPLQYCARCWIADDEELEWFARDIVEYSSAHIEGLMRHLVGKPWSLGRLLHHEGAVASLDGITRLQATRLTRINNGAKHRYDQAKDTHLFSLEDAIAAYFVCRRIALKLYPLAKIVTNMTVFEAGPRGLG